MTKAILLFLTIAGSLTYYYYLMLAWRGNHLKQKELISSRKHVSVVIAARNEAANIYELLTRLGNQKYPIDSYEVIVADDGSEDGTGEIVSRFAEGWDNIHLFKVEREHEKGKKNALQQAIQSAKGEIILVTDADCTPGSNWIKTMSSCFEKDTDMVVGLSRTRSSGVSKAGTVQWFEHFDFMAMFAVAGGLILEGKYFSCSAQNLSFRKSSWEQVGGFTKIMHLVSGDDVNLMQLFRQSGMNILFNRAVGSFMSTRATNSWRELFNQRSRWASNTGVQIYLNPEFFLYLISVLAIIFLPWLVLFFNWQAGIVLIGLRLIIEMSFVHHAFRRLQADKHLWLSYPLWMIIQPVYMIIVALRGFFTLYVWKQ